MHPPYPFHSMQGETGYIAPAEFQLVVGSCLDRVRPYADIQRPFEILRRGTQKLKSTTEACLSTNARSALQTQIK